MIRNGCPELLYHYCSNQSFVSMVQSRSIWLSSMAMSNDSMEGKWLRQHLEGECLAKGFNERHLPEISRSVEILLKLVDGLAFCLSQQADRLSQWRGYAADGAGVCIGFSTSALCEAGDVKDGLTSGFRLQEVKYGSIEGLETVSNVIDQLVESSQGGAWDRPSLLTPGDYKENLQRFNKEAQSASMPFLLLAGDVFRVKNPAFSEEEEWRALSIRFRHSSDVCKYRSGGDKIVPYREYRLPAPDVVAIKSVILGPKNSSRIDDVRLMLECNGFGEVEVYRSKASYR